MQSCFGVKGKPLLVYSMISATSLISWSIRMEIVLVLVRSWSSGYVVMVICLKKVWLPT